MDVVVRVVNVLLMLLPPFVLAVWMVRRWRVSWSLVGIGAITFVGAQILHIPFNTVLLLPWLQGLDIGALSTDWRLLVFALLVGLSSGVFEECGRYLVLRYVSRGARTWREALVFGVGHGGVEAVLLGVLVLISLVQLWILRDPAQVAALPLEQAGLVQSQVEAFWELPWYAAMVGCVERLLAMCFHLSAALLVMQTFRRGQVRWLLLAIGWHAVMNAAAIYVASTWGLYWAEAALLVLALISVWIIKTLHTEEPFLVEPEVQLLDLSRLAGVDSDIEPGGLEDSRYGD